jgi:hypothetical protein
VYCLPRVNSLFLNCLPYAWFFLLFQIAKTFRMCHCISTIFPYQALLFLQYAKNVNASLSFEQKMCDEYCIIKNKCTTNIHTQNEIYWNNRRVILQWLPHTHTHSHTFSQFSMNDSNFKLCQLYPQAICSNQQRKMSFILIVHAALS